MLAIDTNIVVRFLTNDDPQQALKAKVLIEENRVFVSSTVLLETEWVMRRAFGFSRDAVNGFLRSLAGLPQVAIESPALLTKALDRAEAGMDFADALHLGAAEACDAFVTLDRDLVKSARSLGLETVRDLS